MIPHVTLLGRHHPDFSATAAVVTPVSRPATMASPKVAMINTIVLREDKRG